MSMRIFKSAWFVKFANREAISDDVLMDAVRRAESGLIDADLGGGLIKQRIARSGSGKSAGYRLIVLYKSAHRCLFVYGFAKNKIENLSPQELNLYRSLAKLYLGLTEDQFNKVATDKDWMEIEAHD